MTDDARFKEIIKERLTERRYNHSLCVADSAKSLAKKYGADENKAYTAGLLHDVFKDAKKEEQLAYIAENNIELSKTELHTPKLYHAICGAHYIEHTLGVCDPEIISAVRYHTTGRGGMPLFEKVLPARISYQHPPEQSAGAPDGSRRTVVPQREGNSRDRGAVYPAGAEQRCQRTGEGRQAHGRQHLSYEARRLLRRAGGVRLSVQSGGDGAASAAGLSTAHSRCHRSGFLPILYE